MPSTKKPNQSGETRKSRAAPSSCSRSKFFIVNDLKTVGFVSRDEIRALQAHFLAELEDLLTGKSLQNDPADKKNSHGELSQ